jgi:hypothetical protein
LNIVVTDVVNSFFTLSCLFCFSNGRNTFQEGGSKDCR